MTQKTSVDMKRNSSVVSKSVKVKRKRVSRNSRVTNTTVGDSDSRLSDTNASNMNLHDS